MCVDPESHKEYALTLAPAERPAMPDSTDPLAALGVMSAVGASGQQSVKQYRARRGAVRTVHRLFVSRSQGASLALRFVLAHPRKSSAERRRAVLEEQRQHNDVVRINITESRSTVTMPQVC